MKRFLSLILVFILCVGLCACKDATVPDDGDSKDTSTQNSVVEETESSAESEASASEDSVETPDTNDSDEGSSIFSDFESNIENAIEGFGVASISEFLDGAEHIEYGGKATVDGLVEFTLEKVYQESIVAPTNPGDSYRTYNAEQGEAFIVIEGDVTNLSNEVLSFGASFSVSKAVTNLIVNNEEILGGNYVLETADQSDITGFLEPGKTSSLRLIFAVSADVAENLSSMQLLMGFGNLVDEDVLAFGTIDFDNCTHRFVADIPVQ